MDENRVLFQQNCEKTIRQSHGLTVVGTARVVSHENIVSMREKRNGAQSSSGRQNKRAKKAHQVIEEDQDTMEVSLKEPWMKFAGVIQF
jgi:hypothetical protein